MQKLVLFDIDGTLVKSIPGNPHATAFLQTIEDLYGLKAELDWASSAGLTDRLIFKQILENEGWEAQKVLDEMPKLIEALEAIYINNFVKGSVKKMPGVDDMLRRLKDTDIRLGLLTGNLYEIAKAKLTDAGIFDYFDVGGFGSDEHSVRSDLVTIAVDKAGMNEAIDHVYLIGDTPRDISASLDAGVNHAIGYAASHYGADTLHKAHAEYVIESFEDWDSVATALQL